jgi:cyclohexanecarboxyl-CoA dehydrogenase
MAEKEGETLRQIFDSFRQFLGSREKEFRAWDVAGELPAGILEEIRQFGLFGLVLPEEAGGLGLGNTAYSRTLQELSRYDGSVAATVGAHSSIGLRGLLLFGTEEQRARFYPKLATGEMIAAFCLTEPGAGSDAANLACRAERDGAGYVLTGEKSGISLGMAAHAAIVFARTDPGTRARGITAFLVPLDLPGVSRSPLRDMGTRAIARAVLSFDHVRIPGSHRLGEEGTGFYQVMQGFDYNRIGIALACLGVAQQSVEETMAYVRERKAFGQPLARFQGVSFSIAEAATHVEACRWLCYRALWLADRGKPHTKESAMTKWWGPRLSVDTIHQCLLLHGHYGYTDELPFEQRMRDVIGLEIGDGASEVMKMVVARELLGRESLPY